ncbi:ATP-binding protein [Streptomyces sp. NPDC053431]|uniref:ATP-binding protein n=1 Tax=Streptomyces sp. NPDC053431 TaxID=3365703 RepID=UPI0037CE6971
MAAPVRRHCDIHGPGAAAQARQEVRRLAQEALRAGRPVDAAAEDDTVIVVSELVTNAVRYAGGECSLDLALRQDGIDIDVSDHSPAAPRPRQRAPGEEGGFGWGIITRLATDVTVSGHPDGKTVHAHIDPSP